MKPFVVAKKVVCEIHVLVTAESPDDALTMAENGEGIPLNETPVLYKRLPPKDWQVITEEEFEVCHICKKKH